MGIIKKFGNYVVHSLFTWAVCALSFNVLAEELNKVDSEALDKTVQMLNNPVAREGAIKENGDGAKKADKMAKDLMGSDANVQEIYKAAAEIFRKMASDNNGDLDKMMEAMGKAQQDPEGFYKTLSPEQKEMIKNLGDKAAEQQKLNQQ